MKTASAGPLEAARDVEGGHVSEVQRFCLLFFFSSIYYLRPSFSLSLLVITQIRDHIAGFSL